MANTLTEAVIAREHPIEKYRISREPYYLSVKDEVALFETAFKAKLPVMLKGPTGCGKTRFVEAMAWRLGRPLVTVACHGAICYLDEVVEARKDTIVLIHPLTDDRRILPVEKLGILLNAPDDFMLVISYNPGYQSVLKDLKQSTRQRFLSIDFDYPPAEAETQIVAHEGEINEPTARDLVKIGEKVRNLKGHGLEEGVSTRLLVYAAQMIARGVDPVTACDVAIASPITDDPELQRSIREIVTTVI